MPPKPTLLRPSPEYLAKKRSEEGKAKKAAIQPRDDSVDVALCVTGGGLVPPAEMLGVFRGFAKKEVEQRRHDACSKNALDNFDIISGASGGYLASTMHATAASTAIAHKRSSLHLAASRYCYSKCDPAKYLETLRVTHPCEITPACMERLEPVSKEYGSYGSILHQPGLCCAGTEACQSQCCFPDVFWLCMAGILGAPLLRIALSSFPLAQRGGQTAQVRMRYGKPVRAREGTGPGFAQRGGQTAHTLPSPSQAFRTASSLAESARSARAGPSPAATRPSSSSSCGTPFSTPSA